MSIKKTVLVAAITFGIVTIGIFTLRFLVYHLKASSQSYSGKIYYDDGGYLISHDLCTQKKQRIIELDCGTGNCISKRSCYGLSRDGKIIAYLESSEVMRTSTKGIGSTLDLVVRDLNSGKELMRCGINKSVAYPITVSPDGKYVAIMLIDSSKKANLQLLTIPDGKSISVPSGKIDGPAPSWSPNSKQFVVSDIWGKQIIVDLTTSKTYRLPISGDPLWSPNGKSILVDDYIYDVKSQAVKPLKIPGYALRLGRCWSPDSKKIMFTREIPIMRNVLYVYDISSNTSQRLPIKNDVYGDLGHPVLWLQ